MWNYLWNIGVWLSHGLNTVIIGGSPEESLSSAAGKARRQGSWWGCVLCWFLDKIDAKHCERSIEAELADQAAVTDEVADRVVAVIYGIESEIAALQVRLVDIRRLVVEAAKENKLG